MTDTAALHDYFKKIQRALDNPDFAFLNYRFVKKTRMDDLMVCTLAILPDSFKNAIKRKLKVDMFPSVSCYSRLSKLLKRTFPLTPDYYMVDYAQSYTMLKSIRQNLDRDIKRLEEQ